VVSRGHETKIFLHRCEIAVIMQQGMAMLDAKGADNDIGRLADRDAQRSQLAIIPSDARRKIAIEKRYKRIPAQAALDALSMGFVPGALKDLDQDETPISRGSWPAAASSLTTAGVRLPRKCAIQTELSTRIMSDAASGPDAFRPDRPPNLTL
jgi:hypothetical protein